MKYTLFTFLLFILNVSAQKQIKGIIKSGESNQPIQYVTIIGASSGKTTVTNSEGRFQFTTDVNDKAIIIKHLDYFTKELTSDDPISVKYESMMQPQYINKKYIVGKPIFRFWPLRRLGKV